MRRRIRLLRRFNWRWTLAFTRKPPGGRTVEGVKYLDCSPKPGGFRVSRPRSVSDYAWLRSSGAAESTGTSGEGSTPPLLGNFLAAVFLRPGYRRGFEARSG